SVAEEAAAGAPRLPEGALIVATGGARGVTAATLIALARASRPRLLLLGRTALADEPPCCRDAADEPALKRALFTAAKAEGRAATPAEVGAAAGRVIAGREVRATLDALRAAGAEARYVAANVLDPAAVRAAIAPAREAWGPVRGVVHGAGVL